MKITANGEFPLYAGVSLSARDAVNVLMPAVVGGTCILGYRDGADTWVPLTDGTLAAGLQYHIDHGYNPGILLQVTGFTADFDIGIAGQD